MDTKKVYFIDDLFDVAWQNAIKNVRAVLNYELESVFSQEDSWQELENVTRKLKIRFNEHGMVL